MWTGLLLGVYSQHREERLVSMYHSLDAAWDVQAQLWTCFTKSSFVLGRSEDGDFEDLAWRSSSALELHLGGLEILGSTTC